MANYNLPHKYKVAANALKDSSINVSSDNLPIIETAKKFWQTRKYLLTGRFICCK